MIHKMRFHKRYYVFTIVLVVLISGCSYPQKILQKQNSNEILDTPSPNPEEDTTTTFGPLCKTGQSFVRLPDGSEIYLAADTEIEILSLADSTTDSSGSEILLRQGQIVIISQLPPGTRFTVVSPGGHLARLDGLLMHVGLEKDTGKFVVICIDGNCELGPDPQTLFQLAGENEAWFDENGDIQGPLEIDLNELRVGCGEDFISAKSLPTPTPDFDATATVFCGEFEEDNPGTPCP